MCYDTPHPEPNHQLHQIDTFQKEAQIEQKSGDFVDFAKTSKISDFASENEIKSFLKNNFDDNGPKILPKATISVTENVLDPSSHLKPVNDKEQTRIPSPVPSLSEMKDLLEKFQVQRKQRENETETEKISSKTNKNGENLQTNKTTDENLLNFDIYDGLEQNFSPDAGQRSPAVGGGQRKSLSAQFKKQIQETNGGEPASSLMDEDIRSHPSTAGVLQPTTAAESERADFNPSASKVKTDWLWTDREEMFNFL